MNTQAIEQSKNLADLAAPIIEVVQEYRSGIYNADYDELADRCDRLFGQFESEAMAINLSMALIQQARYALTALLDETILASAAPLVQAWSSQPLQLRYFDDFNAGEVFFDKLEDIRHTADDRSVQVLEVYQLCLAFGFKGGLGDRRGADRRRGLLENITQEITKIRGEQVLESGTEHAEQKVKQKIKTFAKGIPTWAVVLSVVVVVLLIRIILSERLGDLIESVMNRGGAQL